MESELAAIKSDNLIADARKIIENARSNAVRSVDFCRVQMYWNLGRRILEEEQKGKDRADYGTYLIKNLAAQLEAEYGSGFSERQLKFCRQFYRLYPIGNAVRSQLNWSQYRMLIQIADPDKREYYELEAVNYAIIQRNWLLGKRIWERRRKLCAFSGADRPISTRSASWKRRFTGRRKSENDWLLLKKKYMRNFNVPFPIKELRIWNQNLPL